MPVTIETKSGIFTIDDNGDENILFAGLGDGIGLPYECATGTCGTCRGRVTQGLVDAGWPEAPAMAKFKPEKGDVLMCQAYATGDCVIRVPSKVVQDTNANLPYRITAKISATNMLTSDVIHLELVTKTPVAFKAGQFYVVGTPEIRGGRAYSMVNYDAETNRIVFVIKKKPDGVFCDWLFSDSRVEASLSMFGPLGKATFDPAESSNIICITGGSGVAGIMSILDHATQANHFENHTGTLYFGVRTLADGFYLGELAEMVRKSNSNLRVVLALSNENLDIGQHPDYPEIELGYGFVHDAVKADLSVVDDNTIGYVAGPPLMVDGAIKTLIVSGGMAPTKIRHDKFG